MNARPILVRREPGNSLRFIIWMIETQDEACPGIKFNLTVGTPTVLQYERTVVRFYVYGVSLECYKCRNWTNVIDFAYYNYIKHYFKRHIICNEK